MIKFFRKIRQKLLQEGKTANYFKYAIGEILLVVIGILIALQINNWNEEQKAKANTVTYVNNLLNDLIKDTLMYSYHISDTKLKFQNSKLLNEYINGKKTVIDTSAFIVNLQAVGRLNLPVMHDNTYKELISTGNMKLINDEKSIDAIREYYSNDSDWWYTDYKNQLVNGYLPLVVDAIPMHLHEEILEHEIGSTFQEQEKELLNNYLQHYSKKDIDEIMIKLKENKEFTFQLKRITRSHLIQIKFLKVNNTSVKSLIEKLNEWKTKNK